MTSRTHTMSLRASGAVLSALLLTTTGCRCSRANSDSPSPLEATVSTDSMTGLRDQLRGDAVPDTSAPSACSTTLNMPDGSKWESAEVVPDGFRILQQGVDNYEIVRSPGSQELDILSSRICYIVPALDGGRLVGLRLFGIRASSVPYRLGLRNGDMISRVNGVELDSWENAMALMNLKNSHRVRVVLVRQGTERTISYEFR